MELEQARKRAEELRVIIEKNNRLYYDQDAPELEDFEYDALNRELKQIEAEYPELSRPKSTACLSALSTAWASWCAARPAATVSSARM